MIIYIQRHLVNFYGKVVVKYTRPHGCVHVFFYQIHLFLVSPDPETTPELTRLAPTYEKGEITPKG